MVFEASVEVPPDSSMRTLASRTLLMVPQVALVVPQVALGQVEIPVGIQMSLSQALRSPAGLLSSSQSHH